LQLAARSTVSESVSSVDVDYFLYLFSKYGSKYNSAVPSGFLPFLCLLYFFPSSELWFYPDPLNETMKL